LPTGHPLMASRAASTFGVPLARPSATGQPARRSTQGPDHCLNAIAAAAITSYDLCL